MGSRYVIDSVTVKIEVVASSEDEVDKFRRCLELAKDYCHISCSIERTIPVKLENRILVGYPSGESNVARGEEGVLRRIFEHCRHEHPVEA